MATISVADIAFQTHPHHLFVSSGIGGSKSYVSPKKYTLNCRKHFNSKRFILPFLLTLLSNVHKSVGIQHVVFAENAYTKVIACSNQVTLCAALWYVILL